MAEPFGGVRLQMCLLDRLTDHAPGQADEKFMDGTTMAPREYVISVKRDIDWLLRASCNEEIDPELHPRAAASVLNYGMRDKSGLAAGPGLADQLQRDVHDALVKFEKRLVPDFLRVRVSREENEQIATRNFARMKLEIEARLWARPSPEFLFVQTEWDREFGGCLLPTD
jgi:type VI secretion system protein ImpF